VFIQAILLFVDLAAELSKMIKAEQEQFQRALEAKINAILAKDGKKTV
jgi:hypothetical protein